MKSVVEIIMGGERERERGHIDLTTNRHHSVDYIEVGRSGMNKVTGNAIPGMAFECEDR